jgi:hypothetical protein
VCRGQAAFARCWDPNDGGVKRPPLRGRTVYCPAPIAVRFPGTHKPMTSYDVIPMTLGNMRLLGVRSLVVSCEVCRHEAILSAEPWPDGVPVPAFGPRMVCSSCGITGRCAPELERAEPSLGVKRPPARATFSHQPIEARVAVQSAP